MTYVDRLISRKWSHFLSVNIAVRTYSVYLDACTDSKKIVPRNYLIGPFLINLPQGSKNINITPKTMDFTPDIEEEFIRDVVSKKLDIP